jgi:hypothetical protein
VEGNCAMRGRLTQGGWERIPNSIKDRLKGRWETGQQSADPRSALLGSGRVGPQ